MGDYSSSTSSTGDFSPFLATSSQPAKRFKPLHLRGGKGGGGSGDRDDGEPLPDIDDD